MPHGGGRISATQRLWIYTQMAPKFRVGARREIRDGLVNCSRRVNVSGGGCWAAFVKSARPAAKLLAALRTIRTGSEKIRGGVGRAVRGSWARTQEEIRLALNQVKNREESMAASTASVRDRARKGEVLMSGSHRSVIRRTSIDWPPGPWCKCARSWRNGGVREKKWAGCRELGQK